MTSRSPRHARLALLAGFGLLAALCGISSPRAAWAQTPQQETVDVSAAPSVNPGPEVVLSWPVDPDATSYTIYRKFPAQPNYGNAIKTINALTAPTSTGYMDTGVSDNPTTVTNTDTTTTTVDTIGPYEYEVVKQGQIPNGNSYTGYGNVYTGYELPLTENRGTVLLVVDSTYASDPALASRLTRFEQDLTGDGWNVVTNQVARDVGVNAAGIPNDSAPHGQAVRALKAYIQNEYNDLGGSQAVKAVVLFGHVPVPYAGEVDPDPDAGNTGTYRTGAYPADQYYGDVSSNAANAWTDSSVNITTANDPRNYNIPGDGKFDNSTTPDAIQLEVGRIDMAGLTEISQSEETLLEQYLDKDHAYRTGANTSVPEGYTEDAFDLNRYGVPPATAFEDFGNFFNGNSVLALGTGTTEQGTFFTDNQSPGLQGTENLLTGNYLASFFGSPGGAPDTLPGISVTNAADFQTYDPHSIFDLMDGDNLADWGWDPNLGFNPYNSLVRAALAAPTYGLAAMHVGKPGWFLQHMAMGNDIGYSTVVSQNSSIFNTLYSLTDGNMTDNTPTENAEGEYYDTFLTPPAFVPVQGYVGSSTLPGNGIWTSLLGDPTLRLQTVTPPSQLAVTPGANNGATLTWTASPDSDTSNPYYGGTNVGYNVYAAPVTTNGSATTVGAYVKLNATVTNGLNLIPTSSGATHNNITTFTFTDNTNLVTGPRVYQVRAVNLETSASGSYYEQSTGIFQAYDPASPSPSCNIVAPINYENPNGITGADGAPYNTTNGALYTQGANITVEASATAGNPNAQVQEVQFYLNGKSIGAATSAPYRTTITGIAAGQYTLSAIATDTAGNTGTSQDVRLYVFRPNVPPQAFSGGPVNNWVDTSPESGTTPPVTRGGGSVTLNANGAVFSLNVPPFDTSPYSGISLYGSFTTNGTAAGQRLKITFPATGALKQTAIVTMPAINTTYNNNGFPLIPLTNTTGSPGGSINEQMNIDGITIQDLNNTHQSFTINYLSFNENGRRGDAAPSVVIRNPTTNTTAATPYDTTIRVDAADTDSGISAVDIFDGSTFLGAAAPPPVTSGNTFSSYTLPLNNVAPGTHVYTAEAISQLGNVTTSAPVTVTVESAPDITGLVQAPDGVNADGTTKYIPVPNATVTVTTSAGAPVTTFTTGSTSDNGAVNFVGIIDAGTYDITASAPIYGTSGVTQVTIPETNPGPIDIDLPAAPTTLDGLVTDAATGAAVDGATVTLSTPAANSTTSAPVAGTAVATLTTTNESTDPLGNTVNYLDGVTAGTYIATATASGYGTTAPVYITVTPNVINTQSFSLPAQASSLGGLVTDAATGQPVTGATVTVTDGHGNVTNLTTTAPQPQPANATVSPSLTSVSVSPTAVIGSAGATGTVTLASAAPAGGEVVSLTTSNSAVATAPTSVTVPSGSSTATFPITTFAVTTDSAATITASLAGISQTATMTVDTSASFALSLSASTAMQGSPITGTVTLPAAATATTTVTLASSNPADASVPSSVVVAAGSSTATFTVSTFATETGATITASLGAASSSQTLNIVTNTDVNYFDTVPAGTYSVQAKTANDVSAVQSVTVGSTGFTRADLTLLPTVQGLSLSLNGATAANPVISAGQTVTGTVTLSDAAPTGGTFVSVATSNTTAVSAVYGLTIPAGQTTGTFMITGNTVASSTTVTITASVNNSQATAQVTVSPVPVAAISFSPTAITAGGTSTGTVFLNTSGNSIVAPSGGLTVNLTSQSPAVTVPATVTIPAGSTSATFTATGTDAFAMPTTAVVTASTTSSSVTVQASLTVNPATLSALSVGPTSVIGNAGSTGTVTISGPAPVANPSIGQPSGLTVYLSSSSAVASVPAMVTVAAGATTATFPVTTSGVSSSATATITASAGGVSKTATLTVGTISGFSLALSASSVTAGTPVTGTVTLGSAVPSATTVTLTSSSSAAVVPASVIVAAGATTATFQINTYSAASGVTITANLSGQTSSQTLTVTANAGYSYGIGWQLLSLPYDYTGQTPASIFGSGNLGLFRWNPAITNYIETPTAPADTVHPGYGYWEYFNQPTQVTAVGTPTDESQAQTLGLLPGWNMIGDPFEAVEDVSNLTFTSGSTVTKYANAGSLILALYSYTPGANGTVGSYNLLSSGSTLQPGQGYWIYATQALTLTYPSPISITPPPPTAP